MKIKIALTIVGLTILGWLLFGFFGIQALWIDRVVNEPIPMTPTVDGSTTTSTEPSITTLAQGVFTQGDSTYTINGTVVVTEDSGARVISFRDFNVTNGPDLFVYIVTSPNTDNQTVKEAVREGKFVNIGALKGNKGNQTYTLPPEIELNENTVISIWCRRFSRNFGSADLALN